jgi:hypothetical protein
MLQIFDEVSPILIIQLSIIRLQLVMMAEHQCAIFAAEMHSPTLAIAEEFAVVAWL